MEKTKAAQKKEQLMPSAKNGWDRIEKQDEQKIFDFAKGYMDFMTLCKTEREVTSFTEKALVAAGFEAFDPKKPLKAGDRIYVNNRGKAVMAAVIGSEDIEKGVDIAAAHIDSPRLDLKQHPLYEDGELALFKTHYYGGIKKYQWSTVPLSLHGVIVRADGEKVEINIGENDGDPQFVVTDLLPHLGREQSKRPLSEGIKGEELNILLGSRPFNSDPESERVKLNIINILNEKYGITDEDFVTAELEAVPAAKPVDIGFDRSLIGAYGHDDRCCAYPVLEAIIGCKAPKRTAVAVLTDKEEIGSDGNTGLHSAYMKYFIEDIAENMGSKGRWVLSNSRCLSADVNAAFDPTFAEPFERNNASYVNYGAVLTKYTGAGGKSSTSDAGAEFVGEISRSMDGKNVVWQTGELGKVDFGGGGTVAKYVAELNVDVIDLGVPVLSMHAPFEVISKLDLYMTFKAVEALYSSER